MPLPVLATLHFAPSICLPSPPHRARAVWFGEAALSWAVTCGSTRRLRGCACCGAHLGSLCAAPRAVDDQVSAVRVVGAGGLGDADYYVGTWKGHNGYCALNEEGQTKCLGPWAMYAASIYWASMTM